MFFQDRLKKKAGFLCLAFALCAFGPATVPDAGAAAQRPASRTAAKQKAAAATPVAPRYAHIVIDGASGAVLSATNEDQKRNMASLAKIMTLVMVFDALKDGRLATDQKLAVSANAARQPATNVQLKAGQTIDVDTLIRALTVHSANDAATVFAEALGGSEPRFAGMMTAKALSWGIDARFVNASGLPNRDRRGNLLPHQNEITPRDMAQLARRLVTDYAPWYHYFSATSVTVNGRTYASHDYLLTGNKARKIEAYDGMDNNKTGYIRASGYNLVALAQRNGDRVIGVVFGARSDAERARTMTALLDAGFEELDNKKKAPPPPPPPAP